MMNRIFGSLLISLWFFACASQSSAKELLFQAEPLDYTDVKGGDKELSEAYRTEFNPRMFSNQKWLQRLSYSSYKPDVDETMEIYSTPDGSRRLSHRLANPSLSALVLRRVVYNAKFNLHKELDAVAITSHDVALPEKVAKELELLWQTMLPGVAKAPEPRILAVHAPIFDAWVRRDRSVETGRICLAAYDTPVYRQFVDVIQDLRDVCDRSAGPNDPVFSRLPERLRRLRMKLESTASSVSSDSA